MGRLSMRAWRTLVSSIAGLILSGTSPAIAQISTPTIGLIERVLMVSSQVNHADRTVLGTIFSFDADRREYWITAKHLLTGAEKPPYGIVTEQ